MEDTKSKKHLKCYIYTRGFTSMQVYGNRLDARKQKASTLYKDYFHYACKHRGIVDGHSCIYRKQWGEDRVNGVVAEIIRKLMQYRMDKFYDVISALEDTISEVSVVGFSNSAGGKIIIDVDDETREVVGVPEDQVFGLMDKITNAISDSCTPQIIPDVTLQSIEDKTTIVIEIYPGRQRPYFISSEGKEKGVYIRTSGTTRPADEVQIKELEFEGSNRYFDQTYAVGYEATPEKIKELCKKRFQKC